MTRTVVFAQRHMVHFRVPFYEKLRHALARHDVQVRVLVGEPTTDEAAKIDAGQLPWGEHRRTRYHFGGSLCWMPMKADPGDDGLLVLAQENRLVLNHWELLRPRRYRLAFWGHGRNMQSRVPDGLRERFKHWTTQRADWYFAYTDVSYRTLRDHGYPAERITVINNAIDTQQMIADRDSIDAGETQALRESLHLDGKPVGMFLGSLYAQKGLDFGFDAALAIRGRVPDFNWLVMGNGPDRGKVEAMAAEHPWVHWVGARRDRDKALYASLCDVLMIPSAIGLVALDSFALGKPIVATHENNHGPEIAYLQDGVDCVMTARSVAAYVDAVAALLTDRERLRNMQRRCLLKASTYSIEAMVDNMRCGVLAAMDAPLDARHPARPPLL
jgi:glycosyltransferase involved in cell wall biosynthesis